MKRRQRLNKFGRRLNEASAEFSRIEEWLDEMGVENYTINDDGTVDVEGNVLLEDDEIPDYIQFNKVTGSFDYSELDNHDLVGCPREVLGHFWVEDGSYLSSLEGCPRYVGGDFSCKSYRSNKKFTANEVTRRCKVGGNVIVTASDNCK